VPRRFDADRVRRRHVACQEVGLAAAAAEVDVTALAAPARLGIQSVPRKRPRPSGAAQISASGRLPTFSKVMPGISWATWQGSARPSGLTSRKRRPSRPCRPAGSRVVVGDDEEHLHLAPEALRAASASSRARSSCSREAGGPCGSRAPSRGTGVLASSSCPPTTLGERDDVRDVVEIVPMQHGVDRQRKPGPLTQRATSTSARTSGGRDPIRRGRLDVLDRELHIVEPELPERARRVCVSGIPLVIRFV